VSELKDYYNEGDTFEVTAFSNGWQSQIFTASDDYDAASVKLLIYRVGSPGTVTVSLRATMDDCIPTGSDLASGTINGNDLSTDTSGEWVEITFSEPLSLVSGTHYAIVVKAEGADPSNAVKWRSDSSGDYDGGNAANYDGFEWIPDPDYDHMFEVYAGESAPTEITIDQTVATKRIVVAGYNSIYYEDV
jgi:hypothetical protein